MPPCSHTGTPSGFDGLRHLTASTTSGSASRINARICASVAPRQSSSLATFASIASDALRSLSVMILSPSSAAGDPAGDRRGLFQPAREPVLVDILAFVDVEIAHVHILRRDRRQRVERRALEEGDRKRGV